MEYKRLQSNNPIGRNTERIVLNVFPLVTIYDKGLLTKDLKPPNKRKIVNNVTTLQGNRVK